MATILIQAVNGDKKSNPFKLYVSDTDIKLPKKFVLRVDAGEPTSQGEETLKVNNANLKAIATHNKDYLEKKITGFRHKQDDTVYIIASQFIDSLPGISELDNSEVF